VLCNDEKDSPASPEKEAEAFDLLLASMSDSSFARVNIQVLHLCSETRFTSKDTRMGLLLNSTSRALDYFFHSTMLLEEQCPM